MADQWYSIVEYAREFAVSDMTVRRRIKTGRLPAVLRDGKYYIPVDSKGRPSQEAVQQATQPQTVRKETPAPIQRSHHNPPAHTEMIVVKASAHAPTKNTFSMPERVVQANPVVRKPRILTQASSVIPESIRESFDNVETASMDAAALLNFCEATLRKLTDAENRVEAHCQSRLQHFESDLRAKDLELVQLRQQVEDLQLLVKILEKKQSA